MIYSQQKKDSKTSTQPSLQKYVVTWQSATYPALSNKISDLKYSRIPHSRNYDKLRLEAVIEASSIERLREAIKSCFPDCEELRYKLYKPGKDMSICQRLQIAINSAPGNA